MGRSACAHGDFPWKPSPVSKRCWRTAWLGGCSKAAAFRKAGSPQKRFSTTAIRLPGRRIRRTWGRFASTRKQQRACSSRRMWVPGAVSRQQPAYVLGLRRPEHNWLRRVLLGHLNGYAAFKSAADMQAHQEKYAQLHREQREEGRL